jgi:hypothetical protein
MTYELILKMGAVRWPPNEQHPSGTERLYEDSEFWTGIDGCDSYGADLLTGNKTTRRTTRRSIPRAKRSSSRSTAVAA